MMKTTLGIGLLMTVPLWATAALSYDMNKDLKNKGPNAYDLTVILSGREDITGHFDGYTTGPLRGHFDSFSFGPRGPNTALVWDDFFDGVNNIINTNQTIHVGWTTRRPFDKGGKIKDMYWTDQLGNRLPGSVIYNITSGWTYTSSRKLSAVFVNDFIPNPEFASRQILSITDLQFVVLPARLPLHELNTENTILGSLLRPAPGCENITVTLEGSVGCQLPVTVEPGQWVVLRYGVAANGSAAESLDFVQFQPVPEPSTILSLLALGTLGAASTLKRKLKPSQSTEKETTKVS